MPSSQRKLRGTCSHACVWWWAMDMIILYFSNRSIGRLLFGPSATVVTHHTIILPTDRLCWHGHAKSFSAEQLDLCKQGANKVQTNKVQTSLIAEIPIPTFSFIGTPRPVAFWFSLHTSLAAGHLFSVRLRSRVCWQVGGMVWYPFIPDAVTFHGAMFIAWSTVLVVSL